MYSWINAEPESSRSKTYYSNFVFLMKTILKGFFSSKNKPFEFTDIIDCLNSITMLNKNDIDSLKNELSSINEKLELKQQSVETETKDIASKENYLEVTDIDYAIITALEDDEMEKVLPFIDKISEVDNTNHFIEIGVLRGNPNKKIVYASQHNTGMVDASILASELILRFKPKFLIMVGVLGGKPIDTSIGDVVIATKVFEIDKGKINDTGFKKEASMATLTNKEIKKISRSKKQIESHLNSIDETRNTNVKIHFGPIACVNQVIDVEGFFKEEIETIDRKAIALEMESFAVVRATELLNSGRTTPIIIKSVMDNTQSKTDNAKPYASWTSAKTLEFILTKGII
jgi:nucleoside phosphorylase